MANLDFSRLCKVTGRDEFGELSYRMKQTMQKQHYYKVIIAETERMSRLITTLIDLSALENGATELVPERSDVVEFLETVAGRLLMNAPDTDFDLQYELPSD